jgi:hypothetical protein
MSLCDTIPKIYFREKIQWGRGSRITLGRGRDVHIKGDADWKTRLKFDKAIRQSMSSRTAELAWRL